jgi:hypothetical protein
MISSDALQYFSHTLLLACPATLATTQYLKYNILDLFILLFIQETQVGNCQLDQTGNARHHGAFLGELVTSYLMKSRVSGVWRV